MHAKLLYITGDLYYNDFGEKFSRSVRRRARFNNRGVATVGSCMRQLSANYE